MIANLSDRKFIIFNEKVNLRKSFAGLMAEVRSSNHIESFFNNTGVVFINRRNNMFKCIYWENEGPAIWHKRLQKGTFTSELVPDAELTFQEFLLFLHGMIPQENRVKNS